MSHDAFVAVRAAGTNILRQGVKMDRTVLLPAPRPGFELKNNENQQKKTMKINEDQAFAWTSARFRGFSMVSKRSGDGFRHVEAGLGLVRDLPMAC